MIRRTLLLASVLLHALGTALAQTDPDRAYTQGLRYRVDWSQTPPALIWDGTPAPSRLTVTAPGLGYVVDAGDTARLLLDWRDGRRELVDRDYAGASFFDWALAEVQGGRPYDRRARTRRPSREHPADADTEQTWTGVRTVRLSNPGHEMVFTLTPDSATATDNGVPLPLSGADGNYRAFGPDFEVGVSVRADGYVYHYYRPRE